MRYESNILKRLIDTYGVVGNPRYISEIIKEFIVRGKERFPNLFTYQADWLAHIDEFGLTPEYTVSYTGQSIYAPNTLERPVKSAILKGCTRYCDKYGYVVDDYDNYSIVYTSGYRLNEATGTIVEEPNHAVSEFIRLKDGIASIKIQGAVTRRVCFYNSNKEHLKGSSSTNGDSSTFNIPSNATYFKFSLNRSNLTNEVFDEKDNVIYDTSNNLTLKTVKMPVLTTSNEDGTKTNILTVNEDVELGSVGEVKDELNLLTGQLTQRTETRAYQEGDESNSEVITDMANTRYKLPKESIKTFDLTIKDQNDVEVSQLSSFNGGTHFSTSSQEGSLLPSLIVDVVTNLEETLKVCSLEGNTM